MAALRTICKEIFLQDKSVRCSSVDSVTRIGKGAWSAIYLAQTDRGPFVVKMKLAGNDDLAKEYENLKQVAHLGIAPRAYAHGSHEGSEYLIESHIAGKRLRWRGNTDEEIKAVAQFFNTVHSIRFPKREYVAKKKAYWEKTYVAAKKTLPEHELARYRAGIDAVTDMLERNKKFFEGKRACVLRFEDPNPHNLIMQNRKIVAVDWAMSKPGHYAPDIADFFMKANLNERKRELFLKHYHAPERDFAQRIALQCTERRLGLVTWHVDRLNRIKNGEIKPRSSYERWHERFLRVLKKLEKELHTQVP